jgi:hypothetical protein
MPAVVNHVWDLVWQKKYTGWLDYADVAALVLAKSVSHQTKAGLLSTIASALTPDDEHRCMCWTVRRVCPRFALTVVR